MKNRDFLVFAVVLLSLTLSLSARADVDRINVASSPYEAVPNDGLDDTSAINAAINAGASIYFPPGTYNYTGRMTLPANTSYRLYGDGPGVSTILFSSTQQQPNAGIYVSHTTQKTLNVEGLTLQANSPNCGTALEARFAESSSKFRTATIHNVQIRGSNDIGNSGTYWTNGIHLYKAQNAVVDKVGIAGNLQTELGGDASLTGIIWESSSTYATTGLQVTNFQIKFFNSALRASGWLEGLYLSGFEIVLCGQNGMPAVDLTVTAPGGAQKPGFHLVNGHIMHMEQGIRLQNVSAVKISNLNFAHWGGDYTESGNIVGIQNCSDVIVSGSTFFGSYPAGDPGGAQAPFEHGVFIENARFVRIARNFFYHMLPASGACIAVTQTQLGGTATVRIVDNLFGTDVLNAYYNGVPAQTYYRGNNVNP